MDLVYKTTMLTQGGRAGQVQSDDGDLKLKLALPREMGGKEGGINPEQLFAAAFSACFEHSLRHIARQDRLPLRGCYMESTLSMYVNFEGAYRMALSLTAFMAGTLDQPTADSLMERAKGICPYADATRGNMTLNLKAVLDTRVAA
ncbi:Ohr family peroxiredoxin [Paraburkholderia silvatlantica]|uniref:Osmotically inducible protein OsmC n=1 Tax=Paraburkholderia silvatlantica TaxID=321895 RepID=A0ABR6FXT4_9BURK|nr:Ohr family peroxiredoxin [Paraburkholderia silvatlantica]MBB2932247.1 osmotically inducible protein OsmC [Paraburkholderia silvatlantica]PVY23281.1 osmotically inducible protein OsmC [Paraburkholderia silvatlantica]PXW29840.1 osmotically inducible protein OsmC [Paraburkholderia silvatlantica]